MNANIYNECSRVTYVNGERWATMADTGRRSEQNSPKSSPRGSRSPAVPRQDSTGTLRTTISLGKNPAVIHTGPFYLLKEPPGARICSKFVYLNLSTF